MATYKHLVILKQGIEIWNKWRDENPNIKPNLSKANLTGANLSGANLSRANLNWTNLSNTCLHDDNLNEAELYSANLSGADLGFADLCGANLSKSNLTGANLSGANLSRANLTGSDLTRADLCGVNLSMANLTGSNLTGADIRADLRGTNLSFANLTGSDLRGAILVETKITYTNFYSANLTGACIKDWQINNKTKLDKVICEYIYIEYEYGEDIKFGRRPINRNFEPEEFAYLYKEIIEKTDFDFILNKIALSEKNINNQGIQFYSNQTVHIWKSFRFRSKAEVKIAEILDNTGVLFLPNCLTRLNTNSGRANREPDFLVCYKGNWGILEIDGEPYHSPESRFKEQERERDFKKYGIKVIERFDAKRCYENPDAIVKEFFQIMEITYS